MEIKVVEKGMSFDIKDKEGNGYTKLYAGAGWDFTGAPVDLDLVAACLSNGKLTAETRLVYFGDKTEPGVTLGADNTTGEGDGDDENIVFDLSKVESDVDSIAVGVIAYSGADLSTARNFRFRIVNGWAPTDPQLFEVKTSEAAPGDTVLHGWNLKRTPTGWTIEGVSQYHKTGNGKKAVQGWANLFLDQAVAA